MEYNTKEIYFGKPTFNTGEDGYYRTAFRSFVKQGDKYLTIKEFTNGNKVLLKEYTRNTSEYLTVSELCPITMEMNGKEIPETISEGIIDLYLLKHKVKATFKCESKQEYNKTK